MDKQLIGLYEELDFLKSERDGFQKRISEIKVEIARLERERGVDLNEATKKPRTDGLEPDTDYMRKIAYSSPRISFTRHDRDGSKVTETTDAYWFKGD